MKITDIVTENLDEISLGDYSRKAKMGQALDKMSLAFGNNQSPEEKARLQNKINRREKGLGRAKTRSDKMRAAADEKNRADSLARDRAALPDLEEKLKQLQAKFDPQFEYSDDHSFWREQKDIQQNIHSLRQRIARAKA